MSDNTKDIVFRISIEGVSQESIEIQKLERNLQNLKKEKNDLLEISKKETILSSDTAAKIAAYETEVKRVTEAVKFMRNETIVAADSLTAMRAQLGQMKKDAADGSQELNAKMTPAIKTLTAKIQELEIAQGNHQRNVGNYPEFMGQVSGSFDKWSLSIKESMMALLAGGALIAGATKLFQGMKDAIMETTSGLNVMNTVTLLSKQLFYDLTHLMNNSNWDAVLQAAKELNRLRVEEGFEALKLSEINREEQKTREQSIDRTKTQAERLELLNKVTELATEKTKIKVEQLTAEYYANLKLFEQQPQNEKLMMKLLEIKVKINDAYAEEDMSMRRVESQRTGFLQEEIDKRKKMITDWYNEIDDQNKKDEEEEKKAEERRIKADKFNYDYRQNLLAAEAKMRKIYYDKWRAMVDEEKKTESFTKDLQNLLGIKPADLGLQQNEEIATGAKKGAEKVDKDDIAATKKKEETILSIKQAGLKGAQDGADAAFNAKKNRLQAEMEAELSNTNLTETQKTSIKKKYAKEQQKMDVTQAVINTALAIGNALATSKPFFPMAIIGSALAAVQGGIQIAAIKSAKYATGGLVRGGAIFSNDQSKDNTIIQVQQGEVVLNSDQQRRLGGSRTFRRAGIPGFVNGGVVGMPYPEAGDNDMARAVRDMARLINNKQVILEVNKLNAAQRESQIINQTSQI